MSSTLNPNPSPFLLQPDPNKLFIGGSAKLSGHVSIGGSKNSALPILAATLCSSGTSRLTNVPALSDTTTMASVLASLGAQVLASGNEMVVDAGRVGSVEPDPTHIGKIRGGFFVVGPLLGRFGEAVVGLPGGCDIGARPVDIYVRGLRALGAAIELREGKMVAYAANGRSLVGGNFRLDYPSVGATETLMMAACMAEGKTSLSNAAQEPEVVDLASFLTKMGARIEGAGTSKICIYGMKSKLLGTEHEIMPDRIEMGTFILAAAITRSRISLSPVVPRWLSPLIDKLLHSGCKVKGRDNILEFSAIRTGMDDLGGFNITTLPYPGFPTDLQPQTTALLSTCRGLSIVKETVFENRMNHVRELEKLGAKIVVNGGSALVYGKGVGSKLEGAGVVAHDLRGGMALVLAGLAAEGNTEIVGASHIDRGYENLHIKLQQLGANVQKIWRG